ncbi:hypothetical protein QEZ52_01630 [Aliisedimentitalea scapharcae]|uniref:Uncharacterized protein n=1 Tax=Aliisedimentitalea scapharcae TaxID=1524259 RepID=A0ABZ2XWV9_9RHOB
MDNPVDQAGDSDAKAKGARAAVQIWCDPGRVDPADVDGAGTMGGAGQ